MDIDLIHQLLVIGTLGGIGWLFFVGVRVRELAISIGRNYCRDVGVQFLDDTVSLQHIGLGRGHDGRLRLRRSYGFEFTSDGERRYRGELTMLGTEVKGVQIELHRVLH